MLSQFWIRKDRQKFWVLGLILACAAGAIVSARWHASDRVDYRPALKMKKKAAAGRTSGVTQGNYYVSGKDKAVTEKYYKLEKGAKPDMPGLPDEPNEK